MIIFKFEPLYKTRPWGGTRIRKQFNRKIKIESSRIGESWEIVDRQKNQSVVSLGKYKGQSLRKIISNDCNSIMGPNWNPKIPFPILVKWLDCKERLSLQVHPPEKVAQLFGGQPKTENWYIANCEEKAGLFIGFNKSTNKQIFQKALQDGSTESLCYRMNSSKGDSILVESGRIHAIDKGNLILEIQQNSDTTYRVYDWGRVDINNKPRQLHLEESLKSIDFKDTKRNVIKHNVNLEKIELANCKNFRITKHNLKKGTKFMLKKEFTECILLHLIEGKFKVSDSVVNAGEQIMSPYFSACELTILEESILLVTDQFVNQQNLTCSLSH
jgi:mannose-6-phosphate isomerase